MMRQSNTQRSGVWQSLAMALAWLVIIGLALPARAGIQEIRVMAAGIDHSSVRAEALALDYARKRAVYLVARKMQVEDASLKVAALSEAQMRDIVRGASILQLRRKGEITYADVTVSVVEEALRKALQLKEPEASFIDAKSAARGVLVLPVYVGKNRVYLWEKENRLNDVVRAEILRQGRGVVLVPAGDMDDRRLVDHENALEVTAGELEPMFTRYGVDEIMVAVVTLSEAGTMEPTSILLRRLGQPPLASRVEEMGILPAKPKESDIVRAERAAAAIASAATQIASSTSQLELEKLKGAPTITVMFRYANPRELAHMQQTVRKTPGVLQLVMPAIALEKMEGVLYLSASKDDVLRALTKEGLVVREREHGWIVAVR